MANEVTLGGDRLGSGNKQKVELHNYGMTSFNLEQDWKSSMAPGVLYPFLKLVGTNHDTFDIDLDSLICTLPTKGPLLGSYKFQVDIFSCPMRLYQGILHNNPVGIGLKMNQVYLPKLKFKTVDGKNAPRRSGSDEYNSQVNESALLKYLGFSGAGHVANYNSNTTIKRKINAIPALAYYDIFKCYYSNKQEEYAYVLTPGNVVGNAVFTNLRVDYLDRTSGNTEWYDGTISSNVATITIDYGDEKNIANSFPTNKTYHIYGKGLNLKNVLITVTGEDSGNNYVDQMSLDDLLGENSIQIYQQSDTEIHFRFTPGVVLEYLEDEPEGYGYIVKLEDAQAGLATADIALTPFKLSNIDDMRNMILSENTLGSEFVIEKGEDTAILPYSVLVDQTADGITYNAFVDNGLVVKTYQSDLFNNWLETSMITGENGISALSAVTVTDGKFTMDALNLAEKIYEVLNRVAVSGGTYEDWQEAVYGEGAVRKAETPMYMGGMAAEVIFEQVVSSSETELPDREGYQPLGSLGGKGKQLPQTGGHNIHIKCEEPTYIMGICSLTPRICYTQGNDWDMTDLDTFDDLHKPGMDGIGFQDLIVEQMAWWDTVLTPVTGDGVYFRSSAGKQTAWINYQTAVDKAFGDFARTDGKAFMVLSRNYEIGNNANAVKDLTTYIDPSKFNYAFAYTTLAAQNFWVQVHSRIVARRKMGAQQIPNL